MGPHTENAPREKPNYGLCLLIMLLYMVDGIDMQVLGVTVNALAKDWALPLSSFGLAMGAGHAGAAAGAAIGGLLGDRLGRKPVIVSGTLLFALPSFAMALAEAPWHLVLLRFVAGLGLGGCLPPALALLTENMPARYRGISVSLVFLCIPFGIALAGFLAMTLIPPFGWHAMFLMAGALPLLLFLLLLKGLPESINFAAGRPQQSDQGQIRATLSRLITGDARGKVWSLLVIFFVCYFAMNMVLGWLPSLMNHIGAHPQIGSGAISVWSLAGIPGVLVAGLVITRWGVNRAVGLYIAGATIALGLLVAVLPGYDVDASTFPLLALFAVGGFALNGTITTIYAYCTEIFPSDIRSSAVGISATTGRLGAIIGAASGAAILELGGAMGFVGTAAAMLGIALLLYAISCRTPRHSLAI